MAVSPAGLLGLTAVHEQADREADAGRDADGLPRMVVHVVVRVPRRRLGAVDGLALELLQLELGRQQARLDLRSAGRARLSPVSLLALSRSDSASERTDENSSTSLSRALSVLMTVPWSVSKADGHYSDRARPRRVTLAPARRLPSHGAAARPTSIDGGNRRPHLSMPRAPTCGALRRWRTLAMADFPAPQSASSASAVPVTAGVIAYALVRHRCRARGRALRPRGARAAACRSSASSAVIVCYVKRDDAAGTWVASHFTWLIRTFWWSLPVGCTRLHAVVHADRHPGRLGDLGGLPRSG